MENYNVPFWLCATIATAMVTVIGVLWKKIWDLKKESKTDEREMLKSLLNEVNKAKDIAVVSMKKEDREKEIIFSIGANKDELLKISNELNDLGVMIKSCLEK